MNVLNLARIKEYLRIDIEEVSEDATLSAMGDASEEAILQHLDREWQDLYDEYGGCPKAVEIAMLMVCADLYKNREYTSTYTPNINPTMEMMIKGYVNLTGK